MFGPNFNKRLIDKNDKCSKCFDYYEMINNGESCNFKVLTDKQNMKHATVELGFTRGYLIPCIKYDLVKDENTQETTKAEDGETQDSFETRIRRLNKNWRVWDSNTINFILLLLH